MVGAIRLPQRIGWSDAMELLMTGEPVDAETAVRMGLVWRVVPHDELLDEARTLADRLVKGAPLAQRAMKEMAMRAPHLSSPEAIRMGEAMRLAVGSTADAAEGMRAAAERRPPRWQGR
jgi:enoyl-CoA hydratase/carnithine racemase